MIAIRQGRPEDFPLVMEQVVQSFRERTPAHVRFEALRPDAIGASPDKMAGWRLAEVDGRLAAGIQIIPQRLKLGEAELSVGGVGNVYCWPPFRGHGCMGRLLERCVNDMQANGELLSLLGGDRVRYGHYGWETAGVQREVTLSSRVRRHDGLPPPPHALEFREYREGVGDDAERMLAAYCRKAACVLRPGLDGFRATLRRPGLVTYVDDGGGLFAYMTVSPGNRIAEYAGDGAAIERLLRFLLQAGDWSVALPPVEFSGAAEDIFLEYASGCHASPPAMVRVNDLAGLLKAYCGLLERRLHGWEGRFTLAIDDGEAVTVTCARGRCDMSPSAPSVRPDLVLDRRQMAQLLFGPFLPRAAVAVDGPWLRLAFPLPIYWGDLDHI